MQARRNPSLAPLARASISPATTTIERLAAEGRLHESWTTREAAAVVWELTSFRVWDDLVNEAGLKPDRYTEIVTTSALATLAAPVRRRRR
jgi:hypothetical protein